MKAIHVANNGSSRIYYLTEPQDQKDGAVLTPGSDPKFVDFWPTVMSLPAMSPLMSSKFHDFLWNGIKSDLNERWTKIFIDKVQPIEADMLYGVPVVTAFPSQKTKDIQAKADDILDFVSSLSSGQFEKAIGRRLASRARRNATGAVRGFVRNARFDPNAEDADGDGFVQEGTQFARRVNRQARNLANARDGFSSAGNVRFPRSRSADDFPKKPDTFWSSARIPRRWQPASLAKHLDGTPTSIQAAYARLDKAVDDAFNDGKPLKTRLDVSKAFKKAIPSFDSGESFADFLDPALDLNDELDDNTLQVAYSLLSNTLLDPRFKGYTWNIASRRSRLILGDKSQWEQEGVAEGDFDALQDLRGPGAWASYRPGIKIGRRNSKWSITDERPSRIDISYREAGETQFTPDPRNDFKLVNYATRVFNTIMNEINTGDKSDDERREIYEDAVKFAHRAIIEHELTHASHYIGSEQESRGRLKELLEAGESDDELFDKLFKTGVLGSFGREGKERMVKKAIDDMIWSYWSRNSQADLYSVDETANQMGLDYYTVLEAMFSNKLLFDAKGRRVPISPPMARYIGAITGGNMNPRSGEYMNFAHVFALMGVRPQKVTHQPGVISLQSLSNLAIAVHGARKRVGVAGREGITGKLYPLLDEATMSPLRNPDGSPAAVSGPGVPGDILDILREIGFPRLEDRDGAEVHPGISADNAKKVLDAFRVSIARKMTVEGRTGTSDYGYDRQTKPHPILPVSSRSSTNFDQIFDIEKADDVVIDEALASLQETLSRQLNSQFGRDPKMLGRIIQNYASTLGFWDKLTTQEIEDIREVASLLGGGIYNPYAGTKVGFGDIFGIGALADTPEIFAELGSLAMAGQTIALRDRSGDPIDVTPSQKAALIKLLRWLKPGSAPVARRV